MVESLGMKPAWCIRLRDLIAETDLRRRMSVRSFSGIDRRVIPRWFAQVRRSPLRSQNGRIYLFIKTYLYRVVHNQIIIILFYSVTLLLANGKSSDNLKIKHHLRHGMCSQSFLKRM